MKDRDTRNDVVDLTSRIGKREVQALLVGEGIGISTAEKLAGGRYPSVPQGLIREAILRALEGAKRTAS